MRVLLIPVVTFALTGCAVSLQPFYTAATVFEEGAVHQNGGECEAVPGNEHGPRPFPNREVRACIAASQAATAGSVAVKTIADSIYQLPIGPAPGI